MTRTIPIIDRTTRRLRRAYWRGYGTGLLLAVGYIVGDLTLRSTRQPRPLPPLVQSHGPLEFQPAPPGWEPAIPPQWQRAPLIITPRCEQCLWL
jgi:hypothetical protein